MHVYNKQIVTAFVMNANTNSDPYNLQQIYGFSIQAVYTGTPTGTIKLQASCDPATSYNSTTNVTGSNKPTNWTDIANSSQSLSAAGSYIWNIPDAMYSWVRLVYTDGSSGSSTAVLNATINAKAP
jgi:hypothetical protein